MLSCDNTYRVFPLVDESIDDYSVIITIPNQGCSGCISSATYFVIEKVDSLSEANTAVVFTGVKDQKELRLMLGKSVLQKNNVFIDYKNQVQQTYPSIYPQRFVIDSLRIVTISNLDP
jgi:hypothetical protein